MPTVRTVRHFGCIPDLRDSRDEEFAFAKVSVPVPVPPKSNNRVLNCPVWNQGQQGSCTGFGTNDTVERWVTRNHLKQFVHLSAAYTYYNGRLVEGTQDQDSGAMIRDVVKAASKHGFVANKEFPYNDQVYDVAPDRKIYVDGKHHLLKSYHRVEGYEQICEAIAQGMDVVGGWTLYDNFMRIGSDGVLTNPGRGDSIAGGHCMTVEDYDKTIQLPGSATGILTTLNSWDYTFGDNGRVHISCDYSDQHGNDFWALVMVAGFDASQLRRAA